MLWRFGRADEPARRRYSVVCFPHAGGAASAFRLLADHAPELEILAVQYPGREERFQERHPGSITELAAEAAAAIQAETSAGRMSSYVVLGASLGGLVALETARRMSAISLAPDALIVLGSPPPHLTRASLEIATDDDALLDLLAESSSTPEMLVASREAREHYLGILRLDLAARNRYARARPEPLPIPVLTLHGRQDPFVSGEVAAAWQAWSRRPVVSATMPGGHLLHTDPASAQGVVEFLRSHLPGAGDGRRSPHEE